MATSIACGSLTVGAMQSPSPIFRFHGDDLWLNLHQFLYVLGRAESGMPDASRQAVQAAPAEQEKGLSALSAADQQAWRSSVTIYAQGLSRLDAIFDEPVVAVGRALAAAGDRPTLDGAAIPPDLRRVLERAAPIYRRTWWPAHRRANETWIAAIKTLVAAHGQRTLAFITRAYGMSWPGDGFPVRVSGYANWAGAFSTRGNLLFISSLYPANAGPAGLEIAFHEAMHQWDDQMQAVLMAAARASNRTAPPGLTHALIWMTAGEAARHAIAGYVTYAEQNGLWKGRPLNGLKSPLETAWLPWLEGEGTRDEAVTKLLQSIAP